MTTISLLLTFLINACWQIVLITSIAVLCQRLIRNTPPRYQHLLWVSALLLSFSVPVLTCSMLLRDSFYGEKLFSSQIEGQSIIQTVLLPVENSSDLGKSIAETNSFLYAFPIDTKQ